VIDDDANIRDLMERFLTRQGFYVHSAANADEGLQLARDIKPDLITLDVMMPEKDGWWVLQTLKNDPELATIPVIMLTLVEDKEIGFALGAADFLNKPIDREHLAATIRRHVRPHSWCNGTRSIGNAWRRSSPRKGWRYGPPPTDGKPWNTWKRSPPPSSSPTWRCR